MSKNWHLKNAVWITLVALLVPVALVTTGCTGNDLDDPGSADVVLEVEGLENPAVTASLNPQTGVCTFTIPEWSFQAANIPKSADAAESSFNDIVLIDVVVAYEWLNNAANSLPSITTPVRTIGLGGVVVPVSGTNTVEFTPISFVDLTTLNQGRTANLTMTFHAITLEGTSITGTVFRQLQIETCS